MRFKAWAPGGCRGLIFSPCSMKRWPPARCRSSPATWLNGELPSHRFLGDLSGPFRGLVSMDNCHPDPAGSSGIPPVLLPPSSQRAGLGGLGAIPLQAVSAARLSRHWPCGASGRPRPHLGQSGRCFMGAMVCQIGRPHAADVPRHTRPSWCPWSRARRLHLLPPPDSHATTPLRQRLVTHASHRFRLSSTSIFYMNSDWMCSTEPG